MSFQIGLTLFIIAAAVVLFSTEKLRVDVIAMLVLLTLALTGLVTPEQAFSGFSSPAVITVWAVYIVSGALFKTGVTDIIGERITRLAGSSEPRLIAVIMIACGTMSAFMNNIGATAVMLPAVVGISRKSGVPLSRLLIPLSFASLMGGNMTQIGTPPNILASSILTERGLQSFNFFDFTPMGMIVFATGILYMVFIGRHLLPARKNVEDKQADTLREYITELRVLPNSMLLEKPLADLNLLENYDINILGIIRDGRKVSRIEGATTFVQDDTLIVSGDARSLMDVVDKLGVAIEADTRFKLSDLGSDSVQIFEATLMPRSSMNGKSLKEINFRDHYDLTVLAIWRHGEILVKRLGDVKLQIGDSLLLKGPRQRITDFRQSDPFIVLEAVQVESQRRGKIPVMLAIMALVLILATITRLHISTALVIGSMLSVLLGVHSMDEAYQAIEWRSVFLIAGMLPLGIAMETTGTARYLANGIVDFAGGYGVIAVLAGIYILAGLITEPMSNAAATVLMVPIGIDIALGLGVNPQTFVLAIVIGASTSFLTPVGHQANVLVMGPGGYRFGDYTRVGWLLNVFILIATMIFLPVLWPL
ncbi:MAG TPA: SLC13 family permease [Anaerolineales bacterium]|nr:SLC13 family permease [Anaerolineales bacterium]